MINTRQTRTSDVQINYRQPFKHLNLKIENTHCDMVMHVALQRTSQVEHFGLETLQELHTDRLSALTGDSKNGRRLASLTGLRG